MARNTSKTRALGEVLSFVRGRVQALERRDKEMGLKGGDAYLEYQLLCRQQRDLYTGLARMTERELKAFKALIIP